MSSRRSNLRKIIRAAARREKKQKKIVEQHRKPGETDEQMLARQKRDLEGWLNMMTEREVEEGLMARAEEAKKIEEMQKTSTDEAVEKES